MALASVGLVLMIAGRDGIAGLPVILAGMAMNLLLGAMTIAVLILNHQQTRGLFIWGAGDLGQIDWYWASWLWPKLLPGLLLLVFASRVLSLLKLGGAAARGRGPADNRQLGIAERQYSTNQSKAQTLDGCLDAIRDPHVRMSLRLQAAFGLPPGVHQVPAGLGRQGDHIALKGSWTKGGKPRDVPITTPQQRAVLDAARTLAGAGSLIPAYKSYIQQHVYDGQCKAAGLSNMHGLRHQYAQARYEALTGWQAPAAGGPDARALTPAQRQIDARAHQIISHELGHERRQITSLYLGR